MSESRSPLERRIAIMVSKPGKWGWVAAAMLGSLAVALVAVAAQITPPNFGVSNGAQRAVILTPTDLEHYVGFYLRGANTVMTVTRDETHLFLQGPATPTIEFVPDAEMNFHGKEGLGPYGTFVHDASGQITGLIEHHSHVFSVPWSRIDASAAQEIKANNHIRAQGQVPMPGGEAVLRRLVDGILADKPHYDEMTPWYAELVRQAGFLTRAIYAKRGAVRSIEFRHVDQNGGDVYEVGQEGGVSTWTIFLNTNGLIEDALDYAGNY
jgi:hypothetical protein